MTALALRRAFSLLEMAMVIALSGLMVGYALQANQSTAKDCYAETRLQLPMMRTAIENFARKNDRLPLPARRDIGVENINYGRESTAGFLTVAGTSTWGAFPFQSLGLSPSYGVDCWGNKFVYVVTTALTTNASSGGYLDSAVNGTLTVKVTTAATTSTTAAYAIISHGEDAFGAAKANATSAAWCANAAALKNYNCSAGAAIVADAVFNNGKNAGANYFDDIILASGRPQILSNNAISVYGWGANGNGTGSYIGDGTTTDRSVPTVVSNSTNFVKLSSNGINTCALDATGKAWCWGAGAAGALGNGTFADSNVPVAVSGATLYTSIAVSPGGTVCAIATTKRAWCWGNNSNGQAGDNTLVSKNVPTITSGVISYTSLALGYQHSCGITTAGKVYCWGANASGQVGDGTIVDKKVPTVTSPATIFAQVRAGHDTTCALTAAGAAYCWGNSSNGQVGDGFTTNRNAPTLVSGGTILQDIQMGGLNSKYVCGITIPGKAWCWGQGTNGQLGNGGGADSAVPVAVSPPLAFRQIYTGSGAGTVCGLLASKADASAAYCWGSNGAGQGGNGTTSNLLSATAVSGGVTYTQLQVGDATTCGMTDAGKAYCWGSNSNGQVGDNSTTNRSTPTAVNGTRAFAFIMPTANATTLAISGSPIISFCRGDNTYGQLGDGTTSDRSSLTAISFATPMTSNGDTYFKKLITNEFSCGIGNVSSKLYCWGSTGAYNDGTMTYPPLNQKKKIPVWANGGFFSTLTFAEMTSADKGCCQAYGIGTDGRLYAWGDSGNQNWGDNSGTPWATLSGGHVWWGLVGMDAANRVYEPGGNQVPITAAMTTAGVTSFTKVVAGSWHACVLAQNGTLWCWGEGDAGQLGDNTWTDKPYTAPVQVPFPVGVTAWTDMAAGGIQDSNDIANTCAIGDNGKIYCWGTGFYGALGNSSGMCGYPTAGVPGAVTMPQGVVSFSNIAGKDALAYCAIGSDHQAYCWGLGGYGATGGCGDTQDRPTLEPPPVGFRGFTNAPPALASTVDLCMNAFR